MAGPTLTDVVLEQRDHERRITHLEDEIEELQPALVRHELARIAKELSNLRWYLLGAAISIIAAVVISTIT